MDGRPGSRTAQRHASHSLVLRGHLVSPRCIFSMVRQALDPSPPQSAVSWEGNAGGKTCVPRWVCLAAARVSQNLGWGFREGWLLRVLMSLSDQGSVQPFCQAWKGLAPAKAILLSWAALADHPRPGSQGPGLPHPASEVP